MSVISQSFHKKCPYTCNCSFFFERSDKAMPRKAHTCSVCGKTGHRLEKCPLPGAKVILKLRKQIGRQGRQILGRDKRQNARSHSGLSSDKKRKAAELYTGVVKKKARADVTHAHTDVGLPKNMSTELEAAEWLRRSGFVVVKRCEACKHDSLTGPHELAPRPDRKPFVYWRCRRNACNKRFAFLSQSVFRGLQVTPKRLCGRLCCYASANVRKAMTASVLMRAAGENLGHSQADHFLAALRKQESIAGEKLLKKTLLTLEIEGDSTGLGRFWVKRTNNTFHSQIQDLEKRKGKSWPAYPVHLRCLGLVQRSGPLVVKMLPPRVTLPKARPPVESAAEIRASGLLRCLKPKSRKAFYTDGAKAWNTVARALKMKCYQCSHQKKIFAVDMKRKPRGLSKRKGTQTIDRAWLSLKRFLPKEANKKKGKGVFADVRELLGERVKQWTWRAELLRVNPHLSKQQFLKHLAKVC